MNFSKIPFRLILVLFFLLSSIKAYDITPVIVSATSNTINILANYTIVIDRTKYSNGNVAPYNTQLVPINANISVVFPVEYDISASPAYTCQAPYSSCIFSGNQLNISGQYNTPSVVQTITIIVNNILNPSPAKTTSLFMASVGNDYTTIIPSATSVITLTPANFVGCQISFNPSHVNSTSNMLITISPKNPIPSNGYLVINFPITNYWQYDISKTNLLTAAGKFCSNSTQNLSPLMSCMVTLPNILTITNLFTTTNTNIFGINISNMLSPPAPYPIDQISIQSYVNSNQIDTCTTTISGLLPNALSVSIQTATPMYVNKNITLQFNVNLADYIDNNSTFVITFPVGSLIYYTSITGPINLGGVQVISNVLTFTQMPNPFRINAPGSLLNFNISIFTAPAYVGPISISFAVARSGINTQIGTASVSAVASPLSFTVTPQSLIVGAVTTYQFIITIPDLITSAGKIAITIPGSIEIGSSLTCTASGTSVFTTPTCLKSGNVIYISNLNSTSSDFIAGTTFTINIATLTNPASTKPTTMFTVSSYYDSSLIRMVSTLTANIITATPASLVSTSASITSSDYTVGTTSVTYTFMFTTTNMIPINGYIVLGIPQIITTSITSVSSSCYFKILGAIVYTSTTCNAVNSTGFYYITFSQIFSSASYSSNQVVTLKIQSVFTNPSTTQAINNFKISTYDYSNNLIDILTSGLTLQMLTPGTFQSATITPLSKKNSDLTYYYFKLSQAQPISGGALLYIMFPVEIISSGLLGCIDVNGYSLICTSTGNIVSVTLLSGTNNVNIGVNISNIKNAATLKPSGNFGFQTKTLDGLYSYCKLTLGPTVTNQISSTFSSLSFTFSNKTLKATESMTITFTPTSAVTGYAIIQLASSFLTSAFSCSSISFSGSCSNMGSNVINVTGFGTAVSTIITFTGFTSPGFIPSDYTSISTYDSNNYLIDQSLADIIFTLSCKLPCKTCSGTQNNCTSCYIDTTITLYNYFDTVNYKCLVTCASGFYSSNNECFPCTGLCATCTLSPNNCLSCTNLGPIYQGTCVSNCPIGYYVYNSICYACNQPCSSCSNTATNCTSCNPSSSTPFLYNNLCYNACPTFSYNNSISGLCYSCSNLNINCINCLSATTCNICDSGAIYLNGVCLTTLPVGYINISGTATACATECTTCSIIISNCTSCTALYYYYANTCISNCPLGYIPITQICTACASPCLTCQISISNCLSCMPLIPSVYLSGGSCVFSCPITTYANSSTVRCEACLSPCETCTNELSCLSCVATYSMYQYSCLSSCPSGYTSVNQVCIACISPCSTCSGSPTFCISCLTSIVPSVYLSNNQCLIAANCPSSTYANNSNYQCSACISPCQSCSSITICLTCIINYYLSGTTCLSSCPSGFVQINNMCLTCSSPCLTCSVAQTNCTSCLNNLIPNVFYTNYQCVTSSNCPIGSYANLTNNQCSGCTSPCASCSSSTICITCISTYVLSSGSCLANCLTGYLNVSSICIVCQSPCFTCSISTSNCTSCLVTLSPSVYLSGNSCLLGAYCPASTYPNNTLNSCQPCNSLCATCTSYSICTSCITNYFLEGNNCLLTCDIGYIQVNSICLPCVSPCATCSGLQNNCTSCLNTITPKVYLSGNNCVWSVSCPSGTYGNNLNLQCTACVSPCATCSSSISCLSCQTNFILYDSICQLSCPLGYINISSICNACLSPCATCTSSQNQCSSCLTSLSPPVFLTSSNTCVISTNCPSQTYGNSSNYQCQACVIPCLTCTTLTSCTSCQSGNVLSGNTCMDICPSGFVNISNVCLPCTSPCATCSDTQIKCQSCINSLVPTVFLTGSFTCVTASNCPSTFYGNTSLYQCKPCQTPCLTCSSLTICLTCTASYSLNLTNCLINCPSGFVSINKICLACNSPCLTCSIIQDNCTSCISNQNPPLFLSALYTCVLADDCDVGTYGDSTNNSCNTCVSPCSTCTSQINCLSCLTNYFLYENQCILVCPPQTVKIGSECISCTFPCLTCMTAATSCQSCIPSLNPPVYLNLASNTCASTCPTNTFADITIHQCVSCVSPCLTCSGLTVCLSCVATFNLYQNSCTLICPTGLVPFNQICTPCTSPCATCTNIPSNCSSCLTSLSPTVYLTIYNTCVTALNCPSGYFGNSSNYQCSACTSPCVTCTSVNTCLSCINSDVLYGTTCYSNCPIGYLALNSICTACLSPCKTCSISLNNCTSCLNLTPSVYLTSSYTCVPASDCQPNTYPDNSNDQCSACISPCVTCLSATLCLTCIPSYNYHSSDNTCITTCPTGSISVNFVCTACISPCLTCSGTILNCQSCIPTLSPPVYLNSGVCSYSCPSDTFADSTSHQCQSCLSPCLTCTGITTCTSCVSNFNLFETTCISTCPSFYTNVNSVCQPCTSPCATCSISQTVCTSCLTSANPNVYLTNLNTCVIASSCPTQTYPDNASYKCSPCATPCNTCLSATLCTSCVATYNYLSVNNSCIATCPTGEIQVNNICFACVNPCNTCSGTVLTCLSCIPSLNPPVYLNLASNTCASTCPTNTFADITIHQCVSCVSPCLTCSGLTVCLSCVATFNLYQNSCTLICPTGLVPFNQICTPCTSPCATCTNIPSNCSSCLTSLSPTVYLTIYNTCVTALNCPSGYFGNSSNYQCSACTSPCVTCTSVNTCLSCINSDVLYGTTCYSNCPIGYLALNSICTACLSPCKTCSISLNNCTSCLNLTPSVYLTSSYTCVPASDCQPNTYPDNSNDQCSACISPCVTCLSATLCLTCIPSYNYHSSDNTCKSSCLITQIPLNQICISCESPCYSCSGTVRNCLSCISDLSPLVYLSSGSCTQNCPSETFADITTFQCIACQTPCKTCKSLVFCLSCLPSYNLYQSSCVVTCPNGYSNVNLICEPCLAPCATCSYSLTNCTSCMTNLNYHIYLTASNLCVNASECPIQTYANPSNLQCMACITPCLTCSNQINCLSCDPTLNPTHYLSGITCIISCPPSTYPNNTNYVCSDCPSTCLTCSSSSICLTCILGYGLYNNLCLNTCPSGYANVDQNCIVCISSCLTCVNSTSKCLSCAVNFYLVPSSSSCVSSCPVNLFINSTTQSCVGCSPQCLSCNNFRTNCTACTNGLLYNSSPNFTCITSCPPQYYNLNMICTSCPNGCSLCKSSVSCQSCISGYYLYLELCLINCPVTTQIIVNDICKNCSTSNCQNCTPSDYCFGCYNPYLILNGTCYSTCPSSYQANSTHCQLQQIQTYSIYPMPFTITIAIIIILCFLLRYYDDNFFAAGAIYSLTSIPQTLVNLYFVYLYCEWVNKNFTDLAFLCVLCSFIYLYILNICLFLMFNYSYLKDAEFKKWIKQTRFKVTYSVVIILSALINHKFINILFCKLFKFEIFSAKLMNTKKFFWLHFMSFLSLVHGLSSIGLASYHIYMNPNPKDQLFYESIDLIVLLIVSIISGLFNSFKDKKHFEAYIPPENNNKLSQEEMDDTSSKTVIIEAKKHEEKTLEKQQQQQNNKKNSAIYFKSHENLDNSINNSKILSPSRKIENLRKPGSQKEEQKKTDREMEKLFNKQQNNLFFQEPEQIRQKSRHDEIETSQNNEERLKIKHQKEEIIEIPAVKQQNKMKNQLIKPPEKQSTNVFDFSPKPLLKSEEKNQIIPNQEETEVLGIKKDKPKKRKKEQEKQKQYIKENQVSPIQIDLRNIKKQELPIYFESNEMNDPFNSYSAKIPPPKQIKLRNQAENQMIRSVSPQPIQPKLKLNKFSSLGQQKVPYESQKQILNEGEQINTWNLPKIKEEVSKKEKLSKLPVLVPNQRKIQERIKEEVGLSFQDL